MARASMIRRVAIFSPRPDFIEPSGSLEAGGFTTTCAYLADIEDGDLLAFVARHEPALIIDDLPRVSS